MGRDVFEQAVVRCECGYEITAADETVLVDAVRQHAHGAHGIAFTREEGLLVVFRSQLDTSPHLLTGDAHASHQSSDDEGGRT